MRIHFEVHGSGPALVLLHPLAASRHVWSHTMFDLARDHRVVVVDLRGHGLSPRPEQGYAIADMARDVAVVLDAAAVDRATLVGNSIGGMIALQIALDLPERVRAVAAVSTGTHLAPHVPDEVRAAYEARFLAAFDFMLQGSLSARTKRERPEVLAMLAGMVRAFDPSVFLACMRDPGGMFGWDIRDRLAELHAPIRLYAGAEDRAVPREAVRTIVEGAPDAELVLVPEVGHFYPLERPAAFVEDLRAFVSSRS